MLACQPSFVCPMFERSFPQNTRHDVLGWPCLVLIPYCQHAATPDSHSLYLMESRFCRKRRWRETLLFFTTILYHMALVAPGHNCQEDRYPITAAVIGTLGGPNQYHIPCFLWTTGLPCYLNLQLLSGSGERSSHFISSLVHGHVVQHRSTAAISKITETV